MPPLRLSLTYGEVLKLEFSAIARGVLPLGYRFRGNAHFIYAQSLAKQHRQAVIALLARYL
ncbi:MAG TPA: hypothetical protein V6D16_08145 [Candidatus Obscuribacterales bacterium]